MPFPFKVLMHQDISGSMLILWILCINIAGLYACPRPDHFNVTDYGAVSSITVDSSQAFLNAWNSICNSEVDNPTLLVPEWRTFLLNPTVFSGPCKPKRINVEIHGELLAPPLPSAWAKHDPGQWLAFKEVSGLRVYGNGRINGQGFGWWNQSCKYHPGMAGCIKLAPTAIKFLKCNETSLTGIHFINSSQTHVTLLGCDEFHIDSLSIEAPGNSPNTDGIHLQHAHNVIITNTMIGTGDDCISIGDYTSNIDIVNITCGPGHGVSIGSLGKGGSYVQVQNIHVKDVYFKGTTNGARIKTWQEGRGFVRGVIYENLFFNSVRNPLVIDQNYGTRNGTVKAKNGVHVSDVAYRNFYGTSASNVAINLNCSESVACTSLRLDSIVLWPDYRLKEVTSYCSNAYGVSMGVIQPPPCLNHTSFG
ncbi:putative polygalacturonase At1g80170 [Silene latifolia]|uniref:putative polygalacturonase At1g80170 n=1 Tax=Silene latifolia TaxID=37657 RepID=UPI003D76B68F